MQPPRLSALVTGLAVLVTGLALWLLAAAGSDPRPEGGGGARAAASPANAGVAAPLRVEGLVVEARDARIAVELSGVLRAVRDVVLAAEVGGRIVRVAVAPHARVEAGALLLQLDPALPQATVARTRSALARARAAQQLAHAERARQQNLARRGVASPAQLERAETEARSATAAVDEARALLDEARIRLAKTAIAAPFAGVVSGLDLDPGAYVRPGDPVARIVDLSELELVVGVGDRQVLGLEADQAVALRVDALPGERFAARIQRVGRVPDRETRRYPVPVRVPDPGARLLPGMLGTVAFEFGAARPALRVPRRALLREFDLDYLFVLESGSDGTARVRRRRVETRRVAFRPELVEVASGLVSGEWIAISRIRELFDGQHVRAEVRPAESSP